MQSDASTHVQASRDSVVACFPPMSETTNPYQRLLYGALAEAGVQLAPAERLRSRWLWEHRRDVGILHFHWLSQYYHHPRAIPRLLRLVLLVQRLLLARILGFRVAWTVHEIHPHDRLGWADRVAPQLVARLAHVLIVNDEATGTKVVDAFGRDPVLIPHGTFAGVYSPAGRPPGDVRFELGIPEQAVLILCFGLVRRYKRIEDIVAALTLVPRDERAPDLVVLVAGQVLDPDLGDSLRDAAAQDDRLRLRLEFIPDEAVSELFDAADAALVTRSDDGTSGVLVLAVSLGIPLLVADTPGYRSATARGTRSWYFAPESPPALAEALAAAAHELGGHRSPTRAGDAGHLPSWAEVAERTGAALRGYPGAV